MEVLKISDTKMKIMLLPEDIKRWGLETDRLDYGDPKTRERVFDLLDHVKKHYGFDHEGGKLLVQFYPSLDGGAELFVTKICGLPERASRTISRAENVTMLDSCRTMYRFGNLEDLLFAARVINGSRHIGGSDLFTEGGGYYLDVIERGKSKVGCILELAVLLEFAKPVSKDVAAYITEHGERLISESAIPRLAVL